MPAGPQGPGGADHSPYTPGRGGLDSRRLAGGARTPHPGVAERFRASTGRFGLEAESRVASVGYGVGGGVDSAAAAVAAVRLRHRRHNKYPTTAAATAASRMWLNSDTLAWT